MMHNLPNIIFDSDTRILLSSSFDTSDVREAFIASLRRGDRASFHRFCAEPYNPDKTDFLLFELNGFPAGEYAFLEKNLFSGQTMNFVYFSHEAAAFYPLMSPTSQFYRDVSGRTIYNILRTSYEKTTDVPFLTPAAFLAIDRIPYLHEELLQDPRQPQFCDLHTVTETLVHSLLQLPTFAKTDIQLLSTVDNQLRLDADFDESTAGIIEFSLNAYVFLLTALLHILYALSEDHRISVDLFFAKNASDATFRIKVPQPRTEELDSSSLLALGKLVPSMDSLAKIASVVAYDAKIRTVLTYDPAAGTLQTTLGLYADQQSKPTFHYRDPYTRIPDMVEAFSRFFEALLAA